MTKDEEIAKLRALVMELSQVYYLQNPYRIEELHRELGSDKWDWPE